MKKILALSLVLLLLVTNFSIRVDTDDDVIRRPFIPGREQNLF